MGTYSPDFCRKTADAAREKNVDVLDSPVVGARMGAATGTLGLSVGGDEDIVEKYRPVLERMGKITHCGPIGMGQIVKLANNMCAIINSRVALEAVSWGVKNGATEEMLVEHIKNGTGSSWMIRNWDWVKSMNVEPPPENYITGAKDLKYAIDIGFELGEASPITSLVCQLQLIGPLKMPESK